MTRQLSPGWRCHACLRQGWPVLFGAEPTCAFREDGLFTEDNWNCATMGIARYHRSALQSRHEDESLYILPIEEGWALIRAYKERGRTNSAMFLSFDGDYRPITYNDLRDLKEDL